MPNEELPKWQTTDSRYLVNDRWLRLRADTCTTPDGQTIEPWYVLEYPEWVNCLVIDQEDNVILLRHYRHGVDAYISEIIGGNMDPGDDSPEATITKELQEEIGYQGGEIYKTGAAYANPSNQNNKLHTFLAVGGACIASSVKELGADFLIEKLPFKEFAAKITDPANSTLYQSLHLTSIFFALNFIRQTDIDSEAVARLRSLLD
ncbi:MAG: NUDIX hydrolase [Patescibacteria group bacterium]